MGTTLSREMRLTVFAGALAALAGAVALVLMMRSEDPQTRNDAPLPHVPALAPSPPAAPRVRSAQPRDFASTLRRTLAARRVVVVALYAGGAAVDRQVVAEARTGAARAGAVFRAVNVANETRARALATLLGGGTQVPTVVVFKRPGAISVKLEGYADAATITQAAMNAQR
jgi:hypothetical protein